MAWPRRMPRSLWSRSQDRACSASDGAMHVSGRVCARFSRELKGLPIAREPGRPAQSAGIAVKPVVPTVRHASRSQGPKVTNLKHRAPRRGRRAVRLAKLTTALEAAPETQLRKRQKRLTQLLKPTAPPRPVAAGGHEGADGVVARGPTTARSRWQMELRMAPAVGLHHQRRRK